MNQSARVGSIDAIVAFRAALLQFAEVCDESLTSLALESRRGAERIEVERTAYWPAQARKASDDLNSARIALERCEQAIRPEDRRSCYEEKLALENARRRLRLCEEKSRVAKKWARIVVQEARELYVELNRLRHYLESDLPRAASALERMATALQRYAELASSGGNEAASTSPTPPTPPEPPPDAK